MGASKERREKSMTEFGTRGERIEQTGGYKSSRNWRRVGPSFLLVIDPCILKKERERERERERDRAQSLQGGRKATKCLQKRCAGQKERAGGTYQRTEVHTRVSSGLSLLVLSSFPLSFVCLSVCLPFHVFFFLLFSRPHMRTRKQCVFLSPPFLISVCSFGISFLSEGKKGG